MKWGAHNKLDDLRLRTYKLMAVLEGSEPGLFTWQACVNEAWWNVVNWAPEAARERLDA